MLIFTNDSKNKFFEIQKIFDKILWLFNFAEAQLKMTRKKISEAIEIPEGINAEIQGNIIKLSKAGIHVEKKLFCPAKKDGSKIIIEFERHTKKEKKLVKTAGAHIKNMIKGLGKNYIYKLQICSVHFPMNVSLKGNELVIKNFLGEVKDRKARILEGVNVKIEKEIITVESNDKEKAGQTAANIENSARITNRDRRVFQDGIYITKKEKGAREQ